MAPSAGDADCTSKYFSRVPDNVDTIDVISEAMAAVNLAAALGFSAVESEINSDQRPEVSPYFLVPFGSPMENGAKTVLADPSTASDKRCNDTVNTNIENDAETRLSQSYCANQEPISVSRFFNMSARETLHSPHGIIEEGFRQNPWAMLIATIFLTKTTARQARPIMKVFFYDFPTPYHIISTNPTYLEHYFDSLGMRKRAYMIWKMSYQFVSANWRRASDLCGIGKYGEDAYRIFCLGHTDVDPNDRYLRLYLDWLKSETGFVEMLSREESEYHIEEIVLKYYSITLRDVTR